jgi:diguanylate cyclase (GGDEF)-like protein/PAS domain S-box-containing protein
MASLFDLSLDLLATVGPDGRFCELSPSWEDTLEWTTEELTGHPFIELVHPDDRKRVKEQIARAEAVEREVVELDARFAHLDGSWRRFHWRLRSDGHTLCAAGKDVTERKRLERRAIHDPLTGLPNRTLVMDRLSHALHRRVRTGASVAVLFIDLDRFKAVNDTRGHEVGDAVLVAAARRLESMVRGVDTVGRLSGDEFVVIAENPDGDPRADALAQRIVEGFKLPLSAGDEQVVVGASVGIVLADQHGGATPERLLREADSAMYQAKAAGRGRSELFDNEMRREVADRLKLARELQEALPRGELRLVYQPVVSLGDGMVAACEALLRWDHPERGVVPPGSFVPLAEQNGLILPIGEWVLEQACIQAAEWRRSGRDLSVSVNVSPAQLALPDFADRVDAIVRRVGLPAQCLCLELVEATVARQPDRIGETLQDLRSRGVRIALDDFGKGATSLAHFRGLPLDVIKLDRTFVNGLREGETSRAIVTALLSLADGLGMTVVAEGVEREDQAAELRSLGCTLAQGFWFGRPTPPERLELDGYNAHARPGLGDPFVIREFMRQIGIPARIQ